MIRKADFPRPHFDLESAHGGQVAGLDEAGRGPLAGPVVAAAVMFRPEAHLSGELQGLTDSKLMVLADRHRIFAALPRLAWIGLGAASAGEIDRLNILNASLLAMHRALDQLMRLADHAPRHALIDGNISPALPIPATAVIRGDGTSLSIAAASVVAKVVRDRAMTRLASRYPQYGWADNAGYGTAAHRSALQAHGACRHHRASFAPVREIRGGAK